MFCTAVCNVQRRYVNVYTYTIMHYILYTRWQWSISSYAGHIFNVIIYVPIIQVYYYIIAAGPCDFQAERIHFHNVWTRISRSVKVAKQVFVVTSERINELLWKLHYYHRMRIKKIKTPIKALSVIFINIRVIKTCMYERFFFFYTPYCCCTL